MLIDDSCRRVSRLTSDAMDRELSWRERFVLRLHLCMCGACRAYRRQVQALRLALQDWRMHLAGEGAAMEAGTEIAAAGGDVPVRLSAEARQRILQAIQGRL